MRRPVSPVLLLAATVVLIFGCGACASTKTAPTRSAKNEVVRYLDGAERQAETEEQHQEIRRALQDLLTLTPAALRERRYADYGMQPNRWTLGYLLMRYLVPRDHHVIDEEKLYRDAQEPEAKATIREHIRAIDEKRQVFPTP